MEINMQVKNPTTYEEQLLKLKERGGIIEDEGFAMKVLKNINYYRLSAYFIHFRKDEALILRGQHSKMCITYTNLTEI